MQNAITIKGLNKTYSNNNKALININLNIKKGEIFALLGPNGAGKSTLINIICGITKKTAGDIKVFGSDIEKKYKEARSMIGLVPQEIATDSFERVINTLQFSRGLFGKPNSLSYLEFVLENLALLDKKNSQIRTLSGGMKRRVMIAKALSHEPKLLFLDEPTAGVDVHLRKTLWKNLYQLKEQGVTIFLTTHYIEEAEKIADRIAVINQGKIIITESKEKIIEKLGKKTVTVYLKKYNENFQKLKNKYKVIRNKDNLVFTSHKKASNISIPTLLKDLANQSIDFKDIEITKSNLEEIFLDLVEK